MAAFLTIFSFGQLARVYNRWKFQSFTHKMKKSISSTPLKPQSISQIIQSHFFADPRLLILEDFDENGCLDLTTEELHFFPSKPIGELRQIALYEHIRKHQAATKLCFWYRSLRYKASCNRNKDDFLVNYTTKGFKSKYRTSTINISTSNLQFRPQVISPNSCITSPSSAAVIAVGDNELLSEISSRKDRDEPSISSSTAGALSLATPRDTNTIKFSLV